ncbi:MAG: hypothetical protein MI974_00550 [Chitinophagales bacterium]|nr:hypothetical protein [Chitinophagales bacterium]
MKKIYFSNNVLVEKICNKFFKQELQANYFKRFYKKLNHPTPTKGNILIYAGIGSMYLSPIEILMYHLLRAKGYQVDYYIYDENIPINEVITKEQYYSEGKKSFWERTMSHARNMLDNANVNYQYITTNDEVSQILKTLQKASLSDILSFEHEGINFGHIVEGVMYRFYKSLSFDDDAHEIALKFMQTSLTNYFQFKSLYESNKYQYSFFSHGIYCTWQPITEYCELNNIDYICYDRAKTLGHCNFNLNCPSPVWEISHAWERLKDSPLNNEEEDKVTQYLNERILQKGDVYAYNFSDKADNINQLRGRLGIKEQAKVITLFTNLIWDAANVSRDIAFESPLDCIIQTIKKYKNDDLVHILIRTHPAEKVLGTKERYAELVLEAFDGILPPNVSVISPEDDINSFDVLSLSDIGVVHTSTVGLEMAIENKPVILISETHYRSKGFTYDAQSRIHYFQLLDQLILDSNPFPSQQVLARKYFYLMMFKYQHQMPIIFTKKNVFNGYSYESFEQLRKDKNAVINNIINRISSENSFDDFIFNNSH